MVVTTVPNEAEARTLAVQLLDAKLAACVQILPKMTSIYVWDGKVEQADEYQLHIKTSQKLWTQIHDFIKAKHSYEVPEIMMFEPKHISYEYNQWLDGVLR